MQEQRDIAVVLQLFCCHVKEKVFPAIKAELDSSLRGGFSIALATKKEVMYVC